MKYKRTNRTAIKRNINCIHNFRYLKTHRGYEIFYCCKCLLYTLKDKDINFDDWIDKFETSKDEIKS